MKNDILLGGDDGNLHGGDEERRCCCLPTCFRVYARGGGIPDGDWWNDTGLNVQSSQNVDITASILGPKDPLLDDAYQYNEFPNVCPAVSPNVCKDENIVGESGCGWSHGIESGASFYFYGPMGFKKQTGVPDDFDVGYFNLLEGTDYYRASGWARLPIPPGYGSFNPTILYPDGSQQGIIGRLIGKVGVTGTPFSIGDSLSFVAGETGNLFLAMNDGWEYDDSINWHDNLYNGKYTADVSSENNIGYVIACVTITDAVPMRIITPIKKISKSFPSFLQRTLNYLSSRKVWVSAGKPMRSMEKIKYIYNNFCKKCEHYKSTGYACDICGCYINENNDWNKLAWSTTICPDDPPKWIEDLTTEVRLVIEEEMTAENIPLEAIPPDPKIFLKKSCCGQAI